MTTSLQQRLEHYSGDWFVRRDGSVFSYAFDGERIRTLDRDELFQLDQIETAENEEGGGTLDVLLSDPRLNPAGQPLLSIVVPTLNRADLLAETLRLICPQVANSERRIDLWVLGNATEDGTQDVVASFRREFPFLSYANFKDRVEIDQSFQRCCLFVRGEWIWVLGDDDYPLCGAVEHLLAMLDRYPDAGMVHFERLNADPDMRKGAFQWEVPGFQSETMTGRDMIRRIFFRPGFISSFVSRRELWSAPFDLERYQGYGFLAMLYERVFAGEVVLDGTPLVVQRSSRTVWKDKWPTYLLRSLPRIIHQLPFEPADRETFLREWRDKYCFPKAFLFNLLLAKSCGNLDDPAWRQEVRGYQGRMNQWMLSAVHRLVPRPLATMPIQWLHRRKHA